MESEIFRLYSKDIVKCLWIKDEISLFNLWNKDEISPTPSFSCSFLNIRNTRCLFSEFVLFCISLSCLLVVVSNQTALEYV